MAVTKEDVFYARQSPEVLAAKINSQAQVMTFEVAALTAGSGITSQTLAVMPTGYSFEILSAEIIANGSSTGIDASNTCVIAIKNGSNTVATKTFNNVTTFPADNAISNLGTISATYKTVAAGALLSLAVTKGVNAATPKFKVQITGKLIKAA